MNSGYMEAAALNNEKKRIWFMDEVRGFAVICMILYHAFYTFAMIFSNSFAMVIFEFFMPVEPLFAGLFILISGISSCLSRSNLKRGLKLLTVALGVTLVTSFVDSIIIFGILHFLSVCMIILGLCKGSFEKIPFGLGCVSCVILYLLTMDISKGVLAFFIRLPESLYTQNRLSPLGIHSEAFFSADYFPLFPWIFVFSLGAFLGRFAAKEQLPSFMYKKRAPILVWCGQHALILYIAHQPVIFLIGELLYRSF